MVAKSDVPYKFSEPWATGAGGGFITSTIPATSAGAAASQSLGFPPATATPVGAGGTPPAVADFNGLGFYTTSWNLWQQLGGPIIFDAALSTAVNGYPQGAMLAQATLPAAASFAVWVSGVDNNTSDPDTGGSNWTDPFAKSAAAAGYQKFPSGIIIQWCSQVLVNGTTTTINFPIPFPNACFVVLGGVGSSIPATSNGIGIGAQAISLTQFNAVTQSASGGSDGFFFIAIGW